MMLGSESPVFSMNQQAVQQQVVQNQRDKALIKKMLKQDIAQAREELRLLRACDSRNKPRHIRDLLAEIREFERLLASLDDILAEESAVRDAEDVQDDVVDKKQGDGKKEDQKEEKDRDPVVMSLDSFREKSYSRDRGPLRYKPDHINNASELVRFVDDGMDDGMGEDEFELAEVSENSDDEEQDEEKVQNESDLKRATTSRSSKKISSVVTKSRLTEQHDLVLRAHPHPCDAQRPKIIDGKIDGIPEDLYPYTLATGYLDEDRAMIEEVCVRKELSQDVRQILLDRLAENHKYFFEKK